MHPKASINMQPPVPDDARPDSPAYTEAGQLVTEIVLETFRLNGRLLVTGDRLVADLGLTSARWQVLGAVAFAAHPGPVAHIARAMGLTRQSVRRIVSDLVHEGMLELRPNPHHRRAPLVIMTRKGEAAFAEATRLWSPRADAIAAGLSPEALDITLSTLRHMRDRLVSSEPDDDDDASG